MGDQPEATPPVAQQEPKGSIPLPRFNAVNERMKAAEAELATLRTQLAAEKQKPPPPPEPEAPEAVESEEPESQSPQGEQTRQSTPSVDHERTARLEIMANLHVSEDAATLVRSYMQKGNDLSDALALARLRNPAAFGKDVRGFDPKAHHAAPPSSGRPKPQPEPTRADKLAAARGNLHSRQSLALKFASEIIQGQARAQFEKK